MYDSGPQIQWQPPRIDVVSMGVSDLAGLPVNSIAAMRKADLVIAAARFLEPLADIVRADKIKGYPSPITNLGSMLEEYVGKRVVILASGDALYYGIGSMLNSLVGNDNINYHPNVSSIQAAFHRIGLPWQDAEVISLHGRSLSSLRRHIAPGKILGLFTDKLSTPKEIAKVLCEQGFAAALVWIAENLGENSAAPKKYDAVTLAQSEQQFHTLNVCIVDLVNCRSTLCSSEQSYFPGIPDHLFSTGAKPGFGMISKREDRLAILSLMQPVRGEVAWDIGAGCGSVSIEWARWNSGGTIYAIESVAERLSHIDINRERFGVLGNCQSVSGIAPDCCVGLPQPDAIFIGGSDGNLRALLDFSWAQLKVGGKLVASAITAESQAVLTRFAETLSGAAESVEWSEISVRKNLPGSTDIRTLQPVQLLKLYKPV